jgi:hypothetical protein
LMRYAMWLCAATCAGLLGLLALGGPPRTASAEVKKLEEKATDEAYGSIVGQFVLEGEIPQLKPLVEAGDVGVNDSAICAAANVPDDSLVVDPKSKGIANVFAYLPKAENVHPKLKESQKKEVDFDQKGCRFIPHALFVRTDQVVLVKSSDNCAHNTHTVTSRNQELNYVLPPNDRTGVPFKNRLPEKFPIEVQCNVHPWMKARWLVLDHPYGAISDDVGRFKIADLPAGDHELVLWQERIGYINRKFKVTVVAGKTTDVGTISVPAAKFTESK